MKVDLKQIQQLSELAKSEGLAELEVADGDQRVTIKLAPSATAAPMVMAAPASVPTPVPAEVSTPSDTPAASASNHHVITAPMVGTFYAAPSPDAKVFVSVGDTIAQGQTLCIIEAMKMMNELEADVSGKVVKILASNNDAVEFGQALFEIDTSG